MSRVVHADMIRRVLIAASPAADAQLLGTTCSRQTSACNLPPKSNADRAAGCGCSLTPDRGQVLGTACQTEQHAPAQRMETGNPPETQHAEEVRRDGGVPPVTSCLQEGMSSATCQHATPHQGTGPRHHGQRVDQGATLGGVQWGR